MTDEWLDVVDAEDGVIGQESRLEVHRRGLRHRGVHVFLFNDRGELLVQQRGAQRETSPSALDCSVSEHVRAGEDYLQAAQRGLKEELGLEITALTPVVHFSMTYGENDNKISQLYEGSLPSERICIDPEEVAEVNYCRLDVLLERLKNSDGAFSRWFRELLKWYCGEPSEVEVRTFYQKAYWLGVSDTEAQIKPDQYQ